MILKFTKMQGSGNDFLLIDDRDEKIAEVKKGEISRFLCRRRFSVGADGVLFLCKSTTSSYDIRMRIFNADGSEAEMCGNGIRCFSKYVYERGLVQRRRMNVETLGGLIISEVNIEENGSRNKQKHKHLHLVTSIRVFMGKPVFDKIGEVFYVNEQIGEIKLTSLSLGNPHAVVIVDSLDTFDVERVGKSIEAHEAFPNKINVNFVTVKGENEISVRTYERGVGETLSCGTGATASVLSLNELGYRYININTKKPVLVHTRGGDLWVEMKEEGAYLKGPAEEVYEGEIRLSV